MSYWQRWCRSENAFSQHRSEYYSSVLEVQRLEISVIRKEVRSDNVCAPTDYYDDSVPVGTTSIHEQRSGTSSYAGNDVQSYAQHKGDRKLPDSCMCRVLTRYLVSKDLLKLTMIYCRQLTGHVQVQPKRSLVWRPVNLSPPRCPRICFLYDLGYGTFWLVGSLHTSYTKKVTHSFLLLECAIFAERQCLHALQGPSNQSSS